MNAHLPELLESKTEAELRIQLADFYHLVSYLGWTELIFNHISVRVPGPEHVYLVNPFGLHYDEVTPENLVKVGVDGKLVEDNGYKANPAGFALHGVIHQHRPDIGCVAHTHTTPISAVTLKEGGFEHDSFYGAQLYGRVAYHAFEGITLYDDERERMLTSLGDALGEGREVRLAGFGTFAISERAARKGRNPATGEEVDIAASKSVKFKPAKDLKSRLG